MKQARTPPTRGALDLHYVGNFDMEGHEVDDCGRIAPEDLMTYTSSLSHVDAHFKMSRKDACMGTLRHTVSEIHVDDILNLDRGDARHSLSHEACFESELQERKAPARRRGNETSSTKRSKSDPVDKSPVELVKATSKLSSSQPHDNTAQARRGRRSEAHTGRAVNNPGEAPAKLAMAKSKPLLPSPTCISDLKSYKACGNRLRVRAAVTAATNHTRPKVHAGKGAPVHKYASYDAYESYESEGQALEILFGLIFSLLLFVGVIVIVWGPGFVSSLG
jgi:hypothetical protein